MVFLRDLLDGFAAVIRRLFHAARLEIVDKADEKAVSPIVFGLVPGDKFGSEEIVPDAVAFGIANEMGAGNEECGGDSYQADSSDDTGFFAELGGEFSVDESVKKDGGKDDSGGGNDIYNKAKNADHAYERSGFGNHAEIFGEERGVAVDDFVIVCIHEEDKNGGCNAASNKNIAENAREEYDYGEDDEGAVEKDSRTLEEHVPDGAKGV